jgi:hypothetical protein
MTTSTLDAPRTTAGPDLDVAGALLDELDEQRVGEQVASLTTMPSISTLVCVTSRHDTVLMPRL